VRAVVFFDQGRRRAVRVVLARRPLRPGADPREEWLATLVTSEIARALQTGARPIGWLELAPGGGGFANQRETWPTRTPDEVATLGRELAARAAGGGWEVVGLRAWPIGAGALAVTLRLSERGMLDGRTDWSSTLFGLDPTYSRLLRVEAPDGTALSIAGTLGPNGGFSASEPSAGNDAAVPIGLAGPTRLELAVEDPPDGNGPARRFAYVLDCDGGPSSGIADVPALCARLVGGRYALLPPVASDGLCSGLVGAPSMSLRGTFLGVAVSRGFGSCSTGTTARWMEALRIPPEGAFVAIGDDYSARLVPLRGGTPAERRAARRVLAGVGYGVIGRIAFSRRGGRRVVEVVPFASALVPGPPARDSAWIADVVRQEIERRLHGQDAAPTGRGRYATLSRRGDALVRRAVAAGWDVRSVLGWNLGSGGAFVVTLRLTERELLDGRTGWVEDIAADRYRERYAVRFDVEAPDGTLVAGGGETLPLGHAPPPPGIDGPTRLEVDATRVAGYVRRTFVLDCDGGVSVGIDDPGAVCARLVADRYALLAPVDNPHCAAAGLVDGVILRGTFRGVRIDRNYFACEPRGVDRWLRLLDLR
jgi:hypothetical protein